MKIKISSVYADTLSRVRIKNISKAKGYYDLHPFVTKVYLAMQLKMPYRFISDNWKEITGQDDE